MPIKILAAWNVSIRPCELNNFAKVVGEEIVINTKHAEYIGLMNYIAKTGLDLVEILSFSNDEYEKFKSVITERARVSLLSSVFDKARAWVLYNKPAKLPAHSLPHRIHYRRHRNPRRTMPTGIGSHAPAFRRNSHCPQATARRSP